ncbi:MAG: LuxR C-terminal-related transcriptional regulator [Terriglobales bacterium]
MKAIRSNHHNQPNGKNRVEIWPDLFVFYEKRTGVAHFRVEAGADGRLPVDQAAGLLAMHCLVRGQSPSDYVVMVEASDTLLNGVSQKAEKLLEAGRSVPSPVQLSRREEEVLSGVMRTMANKEIAAALHLSERTVKFHVSSLLAKFRVRGRMELVRDASRAYLPTRVAAPLEPLALPAVNREILPYAPPPNHVHRGGRAADVLALPKRRISA